MSEVVTKIQEQIQIISNLIIDYHMDKLKEGLPPSLVPDDYAVKQCQERIYKDLASSPALKHLWKLLGIEMMPKTVITKEEFEKINNKEQR